MRNLTNQLIEKLSAQVTYFACCYLFILQNGEKLGFTDYNEDLTVDGVVYKADCGFSKSAIVSSNNFNIDNLEIESLLDLSEAIYEGAQIELFLIDYLNPGAGRIILKKGYLGEVVLSRGKFRAEVLGVGYKLMSEIGEVFSKNCRASLGDEFCKYKPVFVVGVIGKVVSPNSWIDESLEYGDGYFNYGIVKLRGMSFEVREFLGRRVSLCLNPGFEIEAGDKYEIVVGCDKKFKSCVEKFGNGVNFQGEPFLDR